MSDLSDFMEEKRTSPLDDFNYDRIEEEYYQKAVDNALTTEFKSYLIAAHNYFRHLVKDGSNKKIHKENVKILEKEMEKRNVDYYGR